VLVNRGTAGPAEIVAAAILENARGDVVGDKTFGDGSVQKLIEMPDNSALILSVAKYYSPSGKAIQDASVTPNVLVADNTEDDGGLPDEDERQLPENSRRQEKDEKPKNLQDDQLNKALEVLKNREAKDKLQAFPKFQSSRFKVFQSLASAGDFFCRQKILKPECFPFTETLKPGLCDTIETLKL
jgi:C-terminal processing protease CtpA/Prc